MNHKPFQREYVLIYRADQFVQRAGSVLRRNLLVHMQGIAVLGRQGTDLCPVQGLGQQRAEHSLVQKDLVWHVLARAGFVVPFKGGS